MPTGPPSVHASLKGVVIAEGRVLLVRNHRNEWELPGGRSEADEPPETTVARELSEETGSSISVGGCVHREDFEVLPGRWVAIEAFHCTPRGLLDAHHSDEHVDVAWFDLGKLPANLPGVYRRAIVAAGNR